ncbi:MAG: RNA methyltransferase [Acidobacteriaceae bacterium]|jgi:tRNA/rRNA methyltransferase
MLTEAELDRLCVVLVRARNPSNIGAVARAMHDFGFARLRVVNDYPVPFAEATSAVDASDVMAAALTCASVADAVADCTLVVGTTAVGERHLHHPLLPLDQAAPRLLAELRRGRNVALLFGSEKTGLSNDELSHCNWLLTIPMRNPAGVRHVSMNLGQAAAVCLYELVRNAESATESNPPDAPAANPASAAQLESITALLTEVMQATEYTRRHAHNADPAHIRRLVRRIGADAIDAPVWIGILKQILWKLSLPPEH